MKTQNNIQSALLKAAEITNVSNFVEEKKTTKKNHLDIGSDIVLGTEFQHFRDLLSSSYRRSTHRDTTVCTTITFKKNEYIDPQTQEEKKTNTIIQVLFFPIKKRSFQKYSGDDSRKSGPL
jgi:hypothetical protein